MRHREREREGYVEGRTNARTVGDLLTFIMELGGLEPGSQKLPR